MISANSHCLIVVQITWLHQVAEVSFVRGMQSRNLTSLTCVWLEMSIDVCISPYLRVAHTFLLHFVALLNIVSCVYLAHLGDWFDYRCTNISTCFVFLIFIISLCFTLSPLNVFFIAVAPISRLFQEEANLRAAFFRVHLPPIPPSTHCSGVCGAMYVGKSYWLWLNENTQKHWISNALIKIEQFQPLIIVVMRLWNVKPKQIVFSVMTKIRKSWQ